MTIAELRGKLSPDTTRLEDLLTSDVFGTLKNIDRQAGLGGFLELVNIEIAAHELEAAELSFWERMVDRTEPDVVIRTDSALFLIEAKYLSTLGSDPTQLVREFQGGKELVQPGQAFYLIAVTGDLACPDALEAFRQTLAPEEIAQVRWTSWQQIAQLMDEIQDDSKMDVVSRRCAGELVQLLEHKNLRGFRGLTMFADANRNAQVISQQKELAREIANLVEELKTAVQAEGIVPLRSNRNMIERDGRSMSMDAPHDWFPTYFACPMIDETWVQQSLPDASLVVKAFVDTAELGILGAIKMDRTHPDDLYEVKASDAAYWSKPVFDRRFGYGQHQTRP